MSERFKPEISVVRPSSPVGRIEHWCEVGHDDDHLIPERALLVRGVPMVWERVTDGATRGTVVGHRVRAVVDYDGVGVVGTPVESLSPVPDEDEALVERVAKAIDVEYRSRFGVRTDAVNALARAAIRAMREGGNG